MKQFAKFNLFFLFIVAEFLFNSGYRACAQVDAVSDQKGLEIVKEADNRDTGWLDASAEAEMILKNRNGQASIRRIRTRSLEQKDDGDKFLVVFDHPADVKGTAFLSYTHCNRADDQWLYMPALKRVKRIASNNKSGPFMGSEFAYEDMTSQEIEKYTYRFLKEDANCYVVERIPTYSESGYSRQLVWYDKDEYRIMKIDFYDRKNILVKTLSCSDYRQYLNRHWRAEVLRMVNHQTGKETTFFWKNYRFKNGFTERNFNPAGLRNIK